MEKGSVKMYYYDIWKTNKADFPIFVGKLSLSDLFIARGTQL